MAAHQGRHYLFFCTSGFASFFVHADLQSDFRSGGFAIRSYCRLWYYRFI